MGEGTKKSKEVDGYRLSFDSDWTARLESKEHWGFYWNQAWLVHELTCPEDRLLEIGVGTGFLSNYLRSRGWSVETVDIDEDKYPDIVSDASSYDFYSCNFSVVLAFEVFEHIPFPLFKRTVQNIASQQPSRFLFSLPWSVRNAGWVEIKIPKVKKLRVGLDIPKRKVLTKNHFWELKRKGRASQGVLEGSSKGLVSVGDVVDVFGDCGYSVEPIHREGRIQFFEAHRNDS